MKYKTKGILSREGTKITSFELYNIKDITMKTLQKCLKRCILIHLCLLDIWSMMTDIIVKERCAKSSN